MLGWIRALPLSFLVSCSTKTGKYFRLPTSRSYPICFDWRKSQISTGTNAMNINMDDMMSGSAAHCEDGKPLTRTTSWQKDLNSTTAEVTFHVVGDAYVDFFSFLDGEWPESGGDSRLGEPVKCYAGGSSVNTATHLKALIRNFTDEPKPPVVLHTVLNPDDQYGQILMDHAKSHEIPIDNRRREGDASTTGHCIAIVSGGERSFMTHQGVVGNFSADDLDVEEIGSTPTHLHLHIAGYYNIPGFWNGKLKQKLEAVRNMRKRMFPDKNTTISLVTQHDATKEWDGGLSDLFPLLDFVLMNDLEARSIIRCAKGGKRIGYEHEHLEWADYFGGLDRSSKTIITRGEKGSVALQHKRILSKQKPIVMNSIDPTGAGDSFTAGFLFGLWSWKLGRREETTETKPGEREGTDGMNGGDGAWPTEAIEEGMRWGVSLASAAVMIRGASVPPDGSEIQKILEQAKEPEYPVFDNGYSQLSSCY